MAKQDRAAAVLGLDEVSPADDHRDVSQLETRDGYRAELSSVSTSAQGPTESLRLRDPQGRCLVELEQGRLVLHVLEGNLELRAPSGKILLEARDGIELRNGASKLQVDASKTVLQTPRVQVQTQHAKLVTEALHLTAERLRATVTESEVRVQRLVERANTVYREVEELYQVRAGRLRQVARAAFQVLGNTVTIKAETDAKLKGEKIYLA